MIRYGSRNFVTVENIIYMIVNNKEIVKKCQDPLSDGLKRLCVDSLQNILRDTATGRYKQ